MSEEPFYGYHTSPYHLRAGDEVTPGRMPANFDNDMSGAYSYLSSDIGRAEYYDYMLRERGYRARGTYEVEAGGPVEPDPNSGDEQDWRTRKPLRVLGRVRRMGPRGGYWPPEAVPERAARSRGSKR
jgi:hypothetical protein